VTYRISHRPARPGEGAPLFDLTLGTVYPPDVYETLRYYRHGTVHDRECERRLLQYRGKPHARVSIYRAVPPGIDVIYPGDWVAIVKGYARDHGRHPHDPRLDMDVLEAKALASELHTSGDSYHEYGYNGPEPLLGKVVWSARKES